ncbi:unnamed protein product [Clavelina lepadiformis]|uniref:SKICH domain-containing protein n=1 Tax=Clavelina lepadiformis TaxID=159417 RepID=A0ABP0EWE6_CLALP
MASAGSIVNDANPEEIVASCDAPFIPESVSSRDMAVSNFSQVIFPDIPDFFPPDADIDVNYIVTDIIQPSSRDWVGLFRVGWASPRDYSTYVWAPKPTIVDDNGNQFQTVSFQAYQLPGDDNEFYQFCYVTKQGYVRGASTPFQFRVSTENDCLVEVEDENGMIILKTKSDTLEDNLKKVKAEKQELQETIDGLEKAKEDLEAELTSLSKQLTVTQDECENEKEQTGVLTQKLDDITEQHEKLTIRLAKADARIEKTKAELKEAEEKIETLSNDNEGLKNKMKEIMDAKNAEEEQLKEKIISFEVQIQENEKQNLKLVDELKTLTLVKEEAKKKSNTQKMEQDEKLRKEIGEKEEVQTKMQRFKDERDLFKEQLANSEIGRGAAMEKQEALLKELATAKIQLDKFQKEVNTMEGNVNVVTNDFEGLKKKYKHETNKLQDLLRNSLENASSTKTAKQLIAIELTEVTASRDKLMADINEIKKEKEKLQDDLTGNKSTIHTLQSQLETFEEKLVISETTLSKKEQMLVEERTKAEEMERDMHERIVLLRRQLEEADNAVALATRNAEESPIHVSHTSSKKTQTKKDQTSNVEAQTSENATTSSTAEENEAIITDLKNQVSDLTTRLSMGADAYKEKFVECHKLEKKVKRLKQLYHARQNVPLAEKSSASLEQIGSQTSGQSESWSSRLEKLFLTIADPDAEEKEREKQLISKLETLQKNLESEQARSSKYKKLYQDEKQKSSSTIKQAEAKEKQSEKKFKDVQDKLRSFSEENSMLKAQLKEFVHTSTDSAVKNAMMYTGDSSSYDELSSSPERIDRDQDEENQFEDALDTPAYQEGYPVDSSDQSQNSSEASDDASDFPLGTSGLPKFNICSDRDPINEHPMVMSSHDDVMSRPSSKPITISTPPKSKKVISRQPIRSPPHIAEIITSQTATSSGESRKSKSGRGRKSHKGKRSKHSLNGVM